MDAFSLPNLEEEMQPTPVFLPGKLHGQRSLAGYSPGGRRESDTAEQARTLPSQGLAPNNARRLGTLSGSCSETEQCPEPRQGLNTLQTS